MAGSLLLIGVHGAGLASGMFLPPKAALLELLPRRAINNQLQPGCELHAHCGFTQFWYVTATLHRARYFALVLHGYAWWDAVRVDPSVVAAFVARIARLHGGASWRVAPPRNTSEERQAWLDAVRSEERRAWSGGAGRGLGQPW